VNPNDFIRWMLKSPFHGLLRNTMLITVTGRRTGRQITTPVSYTRDGQVLWIVSSRSRTWWRNILQTPKVRLRLHGREVDGSAEVVSDEAAVEERLAAYVHQVPAAARGLRLQLRDGAPDPHDLARLAKERLFVAVCLDEPADHGQHLLNAGES
jgi:deazaflavin-dependent oxidoreductase (nitroreductase family)